MFGAQKHKLVCPIDLCIPLDVLNNVVYTVGT